MTKEIDVRGLACPLPVIHTKKALEEIDEGDVTVIIEREEGNQNVQRFAKSQGFPVNVEKKDGLFYIHIQKTKQQKESVIKQSGNVIFITTECLGTGDEKLGKILMKAFLNTVWDADPKPRKIMFLNNGVHLTIEGSDVLDTLKLLEKDGVEILSCGTCLEFYGLKEKLRVGQVTNMYDTVDSLLKADKVIKI
ncbi:MAG: sulfurtransferase-like selenium metabolism protein YedF [Dehalococcoidales bacterium]|nr:sulfurtransferase-like selenium metabolism protein YedF [Dehalococcoidales bacterium]